MTARSKTVTVSTLTAVVGLLLTIGGIVYAAGGLATRDYVEQNYARKDAIQQQLATMQGDIRETRDDIKKLLRGAE